jgi:Flp pilus assembly protein TadG
MRSLSSRLRRFRGDEKGTVIAEAVIVLPLLIWSYLALFVYWDAYRSVNTSQKAAYTISDMISREMNASPLTPAYITGMRDVMKYLMDDGQDVSLRVSSVTWSETNSRYEVDWSVSPDNAFTLLTTANISAVQDRIPTLADGDHVIVVESSVSYHPLMNGFGFVLDLNAREDADGGNVANVSKYYGQNVKDMQLKQFIVTRPRFAPKICMQGFTCS